jgi:hypothetical protein
MDLDQSCARHAAEQLASDDLHKGRDDLQECAFGLLLKSAVMFAVPGLHPLQRWEGLHVSL